jgi:hypothetical protein
MILIFFASGNHKQAAVALNYLKEMPRLPEKAGRRKVHYGTLWRRMAL